MKSRIMIILLLAVGSISVGIAFAVPSLVQTGGTAQDVAIGNGNKLYLDGGTNSYLTSPASGQISMYSGGTQTITANNGNVGIGTTNPLDLLHVKSTGDAAVSIDAPESNAALVRYRMNGNEAFDFFFGGSSYGSWGGANSANLLNLRNGPIVFWTNTADRMLITGSGNVGIGTTSPTARLQVATPGGGNLYVSDYGCGAFGGMGGSSTLTGCTNYALLTAGTDTFINRPSGYTIGFREGNGNEMTIASGGNVGIGTTSPAQKLEVNGNIEADGNFTTASTNKELKINAPSGIPICIGTGC